MKLGVCEAFIVPLGYIVFVPCNSSSRRKSLGRGSFLVWRMGSFEGGFIGFVHVALNINNSIQSFYELCS